MQGRRKCFAAGSRSVMEWLGSERKKFFGGEGLSAFFIAYICPMETLDVLCAGERARILKIDSAPEVRERLKMLNVFPGAEIRLLKTVFFRRTFLLEADGVRLGLRRDLAKKILCAGRTGRRSADSLRMQRVAGRRRERRAKPRARVRRKKAAKENPESQI